MKIQKKFQGTVPENKILNTYSDSQTDTYACSYINRLSSSMTLSLTSNQTITASNTDTQVNLNTEVDKIGNDFTFYSNGIKCNFDGYVMVYGQITISSAVTVGLKRGLIFKNTNVRVSRSFDYMEASDTFGCISILPRVQQVSNGDMLYLYSNFQGANSVIYGSTSDTFMTVIRIK